MNRNSAKILKNQYLAGLLLAIAVMPVAQADECDSSETVLTRRGELQSLQSAPQSEANTTRIAAIQRSIDAAISECRGRAGALSGRREACLRRNTPTNNNRYEWEGNSCVDTNQPRQISENDECNNASVFQGQLRGQKCREALNTIRDVRTRNGALGDATTAATTAYSTMQAQQTVASQTDAQARQRNIMQALAVSKIATGALNLEGAMELRSAASGAAGASTSISNAQRELASRCNQRSESEAQACFYREAQAVGITPDQRNYASFDRMRRGAQQSQDQADAANTAARSSMITGLADTLVGIQAMKMAQMANQNATGMAMPPRPTVGPPPVQAYGFGQSTPSIPTPGQSQGSNPADYGNPTDDTAVLGDTPSGRMNGSIMPGRGYAPSTFKPATSSVSGGGGGGGGGFAGIRGGAGGGKGGGKSRSNNNAGEYVAGGGGSGFKGGAGGDGAAGAPNNPLADMLSKMFPQDQDGKPIVDTRNLASGTGEIPTEEEAGEPITSTDLSIFEQISAKYRQLSGGGRF